MKHPSKLLQLIAASKDLHHERISAQEVADVTGGTGVLNKDSYVEVIKNLWHYNPASKGWGLASCKFYVDQLIQNGVVVVEGPEPEGRKDNLHALQ